MRAIRRYDGNTGRYIHVPEPGGTLQSQPQPPKQISVEREVRKKSEPLPSQVGSGFGKVLSNLLSQGFETEDLLLFAVLFLLYQETKDKELLIIMGGMFLL